MNLEIYVNKQFDIFKIINMMFDRHSWGKTYTLYNTLDVMVNIEMRSYNFCDKYAYFTITVIDNLSEKNRSTNISIYNDRSDYTLTFVDKLLHKSVIDVLRNHRADIFDDQAREVYEYCQMNEFDSSQYEEIAEKAGLSEEYEILDGMRNSSELQHKLLEDYIDNYNHENYHVPIKTYVDKHMETDELFHLKSLQNEVERELSLIGNSEITRY